MKKKNKKIQNEADLYARIELGTLTFPQLIQYALDFECEDEKTATIWAEQRMPAFAQYMADKRGEWKIY